MPTFLLALLTAAAATLSGREAVRVARLSAAIGRGTVLLAASWLSCAIASALVARLGAHVAAGVAPQVGTVLSAAVVALAAIALLAWRPGRAPAEPTRSFGAVLLVLTTGQLTALTGWLTFALATATGAAGPAAAGAALGCGAVLSAAWRAGSAWEARLPLRSVRLGVAAALLAAALAIGLAAAGLP